MEIVAEKRFSQFPVYHRGQFKGLVTLRTIGLFFAQASLAGPVNLEGKKAEDLLQTNGKSTNFHFVSADTKVAEVEEMFRSQTTLEAVLITKDGDPNGNLVGIVRPRDIYAQKEE